MSLATNTKMSDMFRLLIGIGSRNSQLFGMVCDILVCRTSTSVIEKGKRVRYQLSIP